MQNTVATLYQPDLEALVLETPTNHTDMTFKELACTCFQQTSNWASKMQYLFFTYFISKHQPAV